MCLAPIMIYYYYLYTCMRLTKQELFNLSTGWNSAWLCHHCMAHDTTYLTFPCRLALDQRRTLTSFEQLCKKNQDGDRCNWAYKDVYVAVLVHVEFPNMFACMCSYRQLALCTWIRPEHGQMVLVAHGELGNLMLGLCLCHLRIAEAPGSYM